ncbi:MAG: hypothetical protein HND47_19965 [Chloroflexi bacterium]|nr:hypothetical protein [Chloroflexota bacterium]
MNQYTKRLIALLLGITLMELALALWVGMGWFLLVETLRRSVIAIPSIYLPLVKYLQGPSRAAEEYKYYSDRRYRWRYAIRIIMLIIWITITIIAFNKANFSLVELFT